ncbi:hypothetical protein [Fimbriimonas ginsengisoli]|nr:hypothetical protein [Fimbriimonas ginsengisoli]
MTDRECDQVRALAGLAVLTDDERKVVATLEANRVISAVRASVLAEMVSRYWPAIAPRLHLRVERGGREEAVNLLELWGLRTIGSSLKSAGLRQYSGGSAGVDVAEYAMRYVEETAGFDSAHPVLLHVYGHGLPASTFFYRGPGEMLSRALIRMGWFGFIGTAEREIPSLVERKFVEGLTERLAIQPFHVPEPPTEESEWEEWEDSESLRWRGVRRSA